MVLAMINSAIGNILTNKDTSIHVHQEQVVDLLQLLLLPAALPQLQQPLYLFPKAVCATPSKAHVNVSHQMYVLRPGLREDAVLLELNGKKVLAKLQLQRQPQQPQRRPQLQLLYQQEVHATTTFQHLISTRCVGLM